MIDSTGTVFDDAPQHGPRPLPLFLAMLQHDTMGDPDRRARALAGLRAYQTATRVAPPPPMPIVANQGRVVLRDYGGHGRPVVVVPSLINPPSVLDLAPERSFLRWLATQGLHVHLVDWGMPSAEDRTLDLAAHVGDILVPLIESLDAPPVLVGYCLGGTMAIAAAVGTPLAGLVTIAAPWHFAGYGDARTAAAALWEAAAPACEMLGVMPVEILQAMFWQLDPARTVGKFERFAAMPAEGDAARQFVLLEDWANGGAPLPLGAARDLFEGLLADDQPGRGVWSVGARVVRLDAITCPTLQFVSTTDRIVPAATTASIGERRALSLGHVGMIVGGRGRSDLWRPLIDWIAALPAPR